MAMSTHPELEEEFFLKVPPRNTRMSTDGNVNSHLFSQPKSGGMPQTPRTTYTAGNAPVEVSSLFSLKHPLEDVLPVALVSPDSTGETSMATDVFEKVLHTSTLLWTEDRDHYLSKKQYKQPVCVTYNTILKR